ncbi:MAG: ATP-binding protein [Candidatus Micrarchaeota archaeon]
MRVVVLSGKGGTGKSCVASSLALCAGAKKKLVLVDADADCPNQHLLFKGKILRREEVYASKIAVIIEEKCKLCLQCTEVCQFNAIRKRGSKIFIDPLACEGCGACVIACRENALKLAPKFTGELVVKITNKFPLVYGRLKPGEAGSGKLVHKLRAMGDEIAKKENAETVLVDAPAGIGCPVIAAVAGCEYAIGVIEPTPASIINLERALEVAKHFKIPYGVVLNKEGISGKYEGRIRRKFGKKLLASIPYDKEISILLAKGIPPAEGKGEGAKALRELGKVAGFLNY